MDGDECELQEVVCNFFAVLLRAGAVQAGEKAAHDVLKQLAANNSKIVSIALLSISSNS